MYIQITVYTSHIQSVYTTLHARKNPVGGVGTGVFAAGVAVGLAWNFAVAWRQATSWSS